MKKLATLFTLICLTQVFISCSFSHNTIGGTKNWIPKDIDIHKTILLVEEYPYSETFNEKMQDYLSQKFNGQYEVVSKKAIMNNEGKYSDKKIYQYALLWTVSHTNIETITRGANYSTHSNQNNLGIDCNFYDRLNDKSYPKTEGTYQYARKAYIPVINTLSKKLQ